MMLKVLNYRYFFVALKASKFFRDLSSNIGDNNVWLTSEKIVTDAKIKHLVKKQNIFQNTGKTNL